MKIQARGLTWGTPLHIRFGETEVGGVMSNEDTIDCIAPPHSPGPVAVEVSLDGVHFTK